jgi:hypothetical protein
VNTHAREESGMTDCAESIRLVRNIRWKSIDKDNMEFEGQVSVFQKDAIETFCIVDNLDRLQEPRC